ncbi:hypothetical protein PFISCL1PPCAC_10590, partial [Pristionchus fissidentatus]
EDEEDDGPPPLKKVARTSASGGTILWKTATGGAPKQLAFKKIGTGLPNRPVSVQRAVPKILNPANGSPAPTNLATALAGLLPQPTFSASPTTSVFPKRHVILKPGMPSSATYSSSPSTSHLVRRRVDRVTNEICNDCVKALPPLRRSLGRLESRMDAVTSMVKSIVNRHSQQNITMARPATTVIPRGHSSVAPSASSPSFNGNRVIGKPTTMRFVPVGTKNASGASAPIRKFVTDKSTRLEPRSFMHRMISRGLLTYRFPVMTTEEYYNQAPTVIKAHSLKQVQQVMADLIASGLYKKSDPSVDAMDPECIFEKETELSKLSRLSQYDVSSADFLAGCFDD